MKKIFTFLMIAAFALQVHAEGKNGVVFVRPGGTGSGSSWNDPMGDIGKALYEARRENDKRKDVWIAAGEYKLSGTINIPDSVNVYGGFKGRERSVDDRKIKLDGKSWDFINETIIDGTDCDDFVIRMKMFKIPTAIDGLTIKNGKRGVHVRTNAIIRNCKIINNNTPSNGGGVDSYYGGEVRNSYIANNNAKLGGGIYANLVKGHKFIVEGCQIEYNEADEGAGIRLQSGTGGKAIIKNCFIYANTSKGNGSAIDNRLDKTENVTEVINCVIANNTSLNKAAVYTLCGKFLNCTIINNDCNNAVWVGNTTYTTNFKNCIIWGNFNSYDDKDVGMGVSSAHKEAVFVNNAAYSIGGTPSDESEGNMLFADNSTNGDVANPEDGFLKSGPKFVKPTTFVGAPADDTQKADLMEADWSLSEGSPMLDVGVAIADVTEDIVGTTRPQGSAYDLGAYELKSESAIHEDSFDTTPAIRLIGNRVVVDQPGDIEVYSITGKLIRSAKSSDSVIMNVPGVYIVKSGTKSAKVVVR